MGCGGSKLDKKKRKGKRKKEEDGFNDENGVPIVLTEAKPEQIRRDLNKVYKAINEKRDKLKPEMRPVLSERRGLKATIDEERERLVQLLAQKDELLKERDVLMVETWDRDADEVHAAYEKKDKDALINIFACRAKWQLLEISEVYSSKYGEPIYSRLVTDGQTLIGKIFTGTQTFLTKLLIYRLLPQAERDSAFLKDFTSGMSVQDENMLEIILTRTNAELRDISEQFLSDYGKSLTEAAASHSYKNYRDFVAKVLECNRDETDTPFDEETAGRLAKEIYAAGAGRTVGIEPEVFIRVFSTINMPQFNSINEKYNNKRLLEDIGKKLGGNFAIAVKIRCTDKHEYLAGRLGTAFKSYSPDKDLIAR